jgi:hypothetical protein
MDGSTTIPTAVWVIAGIVLGLITGFLSYRLRSKTAQNRARLEEYHRQRAEADEVPTPEDMIALDESIDDHMVDIE